MRTWKVFICDSCGADRLDYQVFGINDKAYCKLGNCVPWHVRLRWWLRGE